MYTRIQTVTDESGRNYHNVFCEDKLLGSYWQNTEGDWEVEMPNGIG